MVDFLSFLKNAIFYYCPEIANGQRRYLFEDIFCLQKLENPLCSGFCGFSIAIRPEFNGFSVLDKLQTCPRADILESDLHWRTPFLVRVSILGWLTSTLRLGHPLDCSIFNKRKGLWFQYLKSWTSETYLDSQLSLTNTVWQRFGFLAIYFFMAYKADLQPSIDRIKQVSSGEWPRWPLKILCTIFRSSWKDHHRGGNDTW